MGLIVVNAAVFLLEISLGRDAQGLINVFGLIPARVTRLWGDPRVGVIGAFLPFLTSMFLHGGLLHLVGNMWYLWIFGDNVEDRLGHGRFLLFYLLCGVASGAAQVAASAASPVPAIGASGAVAGVLGAYLITFPAARVLTLIPVFFLPYFVDLPAFFFLFWWFLFQLVAGSVSIIGAREGGAGGIAWWAHIGGFTAGAVLVFFFPRQRRSRQRRYVTWYE